MSLPAGPEVLDAAWLEAALRRDGGLPEARVHAVSSEVIGTGFGLDGTSARLTIDADGGVPTTLVAKWCSVRTAPAETRFYREIGPRLPLDLARLLVSRTDEASGRAASVRWIAGPNALGPDVPRVPLIVESLLRQAADAVSEHLA